MIWVPRRKVWTPPKRSQRGLIGPMLFGTPFAIQMDFEGANASQTFTDQGIAQSVWSAGTAGATIQTTTVLAGTSSLKCADNSVDYVKTSAVSANMLPATANWDLSVRAQAASWTRGGAGGIYLLSIQDASATAAGTQFALATSLSGVMALILSDGSTRTTIVTTSTTLVDGMAYTFKFSRRGSGTNNITCYLNGSQEQQGTFSGSINQPSGRDWRIGKPEFAVGGSTALYVDTLRLQVL